MTRRAFVAELFRAGESEPLATNTAYAMNSSIRATEALAREYALGRGVTLDGGLPERTGDTYRRTWTGLGVELVAVARPQED